jgi:cytochrome c553
MPSIDQLGAAEMTGKLKSFRSGETPATVMNRIVRGYTDAEIEALGQYFASRLTKN